MKAIIENPINLIGAASMDLAIYSEYHLILNMILSAQSKEVLREKFNDFDQDDLMYFTYGFGGSHMWVKQLDWNSKVKQQVIFVEL